MGLRQVQAAVEVELRDWWPLAKTAQLDEFERLQQEERSRLKMMKTHGLVTALQVAD